MLLAGVAHTAGFAPFYLWWLQILALAGLAWAVQGAAPARAAWLGWCFGLGWLASGFWWIYISLHDFGGLAAVLSALAVLMLAALLALYVAGAMALLRRLASPQPLAAGLQFAALWTLSELARGQWLSGFPWMASGYAHSLGPLAALAPWLGVYGMGLAAALLAAALANLARPQQRSWGLAGLALLLPVAAALAPGEFTTSTGALRVSLLQPNVPQDIKFDPDHIVANMQALQLRLHAAPGDLVLTPESVLPASREQLDDGYWQQLTAPYRQGRQAALIGIFLGEGEGEVVNSLVGVAPGQDRDYEYGKRHLLPFGEVLPWGFRWFVEMLNIPLGDQGRGHNQAAFAVAGQRVRPLICYEDLFGEDFAGSMVGPEAATVLANASNLAWFGRWMMQDQHLQFSQLRAMEFQRPLVRATNTGATAAIDHHGRITARLPAWTAGTLDAQVDGRQGATPYAWWLSRWGLWPLWVLALAMLLAAGGLGSARQR
jgi:apolipoprotein N-acyltransferase